MKILSSVKYILILWLSTALLPWAAWADEKMPNPDTYLPSFHEIMKQKASYNDNRDLFVTFHPKEVLPPEIWKWINFDFDKMKEMWTELVGFTAPELVGKIAPEIEPGKYTYKDLNKYPGLKELFPSVVRNNVKAGGPPFICNIMDFEIAPTRQLPPSLPQCEATKQNLGKTKLDKDGYIVPRSWQGGVPFPRPSGKFKARQVYYNMEKRSAQHDFCYRLTGEGLEVGKNLTVDKYSKYLRNGLRLMGRYYFPPFGWYDERAEKRGEFSTASTTIFEPRANRGLVTLFLKYDDPYKMDPMLIYLPQMRRIRKMNSTDTQDPIGDITYDDMAFISQKITPIKFPYKFDIIDEREYLFPIYYNAGKTWVDKKNGYAIKDLGLQRRACYVLQMTQLDKNYIYSKRIYYVDKEIFLPAWAEFYDQKGRLYRTYNMSYGYLPECGQIITHGTPAWQTDYVDTHSSYQVLTVLPANNDRREFTVESLIKRGK